MFYQLYGLYPSILLQMFLVVPNKTSVAPAQRNITHTAFEGGLNWSTTWSSYLVSRASDTGSLPAGNAYHDMMTQVDFRKYWSSSLNIRF